MHLPQTASAVIIAALFYCSLASCSTQVAEQDFASNRIIAKYLVHDEKASPHLAACSQSRKSFLLANRYDCAFKLADEEFVIEKKYVADSTGQLKEYWVFLSEGPDVFNSNDLERDTSFARQNNLQNFHLAFISKTRLLDKQDILVISKIFPKEKLIFTARNASDSLRGRRVIYQYN